MTSSFPLAVFGRAGSPTGLTCTVYLKFSVVLICFSPPHVRFWEETQGKMFSLHNSFTFCWNSISNTSRVHPEWMFLPLLWNQRLNERQLCASKADQLSHVPAAPALNASRSDTSWSWQLPSPCPLPLWTGRFWVVLEPFVEPLLVTRPSSAAAQLDHSTRRGASWTENVLFFTLLSTIINHEFHSFKTLLSEF